MLTTKERPMTQQYTVDEFERLYLSPENSNHLFELINGKVHEKMPTQQHGLIASNINVAFALHAKQYKAGRPGVEVRHQTPKDTRNSRLPDVSFTCNRTALVEQGSVSGMPDIAVEIKSPDDTINEMRDTAVYYLANGSRLVWLVYPNYRLIEVYRPGADVEILGEEDTLTGGDVLPGFELPVREVFADPLAE
ncbi:MAG: Uma2 family endonuclease [Caldilinea sp. CFX5]|nr:Uma2 family endonuclease [Caldilinea sp. CFX5]